MTGLTNKFRVERLRPSSRGVDHGGCRYFVLDIDHDPFAIAALEAYADACFIAEPKLADDLDKITQTDEAQARLRTAMAGGAE